MAEAAPGQLVGGRYRLLSIHGTGGFGRVWRARDETEARDVAVKEVWLPPALSPHEHVERLARAQREGRHAATLSGHPNIVSVHDVVIDNDAPWIVMQFVDGVSLAELLAAQGRLPADEVERIAQGLLSALDAAHAAGIAHRDVKPANILLTPAGGVLLADFGIAVHLADTTLTATGGFIGSLEYIAPERFDGAQEPLPGDLYSLGVTLYEAVEGVSPFRRSTPTGTLKAVMLGEAAPPQYASHLASLIAALMNRDPDRRPSIAHALAVLDDPATAPAMVTPLSMTRIRSYPHSNSRTVVVGAPSVKRGRYGGAVALAVAVTVLIAWAIVSVIDKQREPATGTASSSTPATKSSTTVTRLSPKPVLVPGSLDLASTDKTPFTAAALLPASFVDKRKVTYTLRANEVDDCFGYKSRDVEDTLRSFDCIKEVKAAYIDRSNKIIVVVWILSFSDDLTALSAYEALKRARASDWGLFCPGKGVASELCDGSGSWADARMRETTRPSHRYVFKTTVLYIESVGSSREEEPWLEEAAYEAIRVVGPDHYYR